MNSRTQWMEDIQKNISDLIARSPPRMSRRTCAR